METKASETTFRSYLFFWSGQLASLLGSSIAQFVIIWWITIETQSAVYLSIASFVAFIPQVILTPFAGVLVDRWSRKALIGIVDFLQAVATVGLILLFWLEIISIWQILVLLALRGLFQAFHTPAVRAIVPLMVPRQKLSRMNGLDYLFSGAINLIGPIVAALLFVLWRIDQILWVDAATFAVAVVPLLLIKIPSVRKKQEVSQDKPSFKREFMEGLTFIKNAKGLPSLLMLATALNFLLIPLFTLLPYFVQVDHFGMAEDFALVVAASAGGTLAGGLLMSVKKEFKRKMVVVASFMYVLFLGYALVALTPTGLFWFMALASLTISFATPLVNVSLRTIIQTVIPMEMLGRVTSVNMTLATAAMPLGMILSGPIAEFIGTANFFLACTGSGILALTLSWLFTDIRDVEEMEKRRDAMEVASDQSREKLVR
ncbi:MAG: MFS transporter [Candidatus Bathyarchaeota archaeon]|nr:MAG: MFS transporter [Candidatus Bathyarchaeota archaeon]